MRRHKVRLKVAAGRKNSSRRWLQRHLNDPYVIKAREQGYRARSAFKLIELDHKFGIFKSGQRIVDLGAVPGSWCQVILERIEPLRLIAVDCVEMAPLDGIEIVTADFLDLETSQRLLKMLNGKVDVILSDMSPPTTGHTQTDHLRSMGLAEAAFAFTKETLAVNGTFLCKVFQGGTHKDLLDTLKRYFTVIKHVKPTTSRKESRELYLFATGFRGMSKSAESASVGL